MSGDPGRCSACRLAATRTRVVLPDGPKGGLLAVGEAPGRDEDACGIGFVGRAGRTLDGLLLSLGLRREDYARSNVVRCRPPDNRKPRADEILACRHWLDKTVTTWQPRVILAVGQSAAEQFMPRWHGSYLETVQGVLDRRLGTPHFLRVPVVPMPHTSPLAWNRRLQDGTPIRDVGARAAAFAVALLTDSAARELR